MCVCVFCILVDRTLPVVQDEPEPGPRPSDGSQRFLPFDAGRDGLGLGAATPARDENPDPPIALHGSKSPPDVLNSESGNMAAAGRVEVSALATGAAFVDWDPTGGPLALVDCGPFGGQLALDRGADAAATGVPSLGAGGGAFPGAEQAGPGPRPPLRGFGLFLGAAAAAAAVAVFPFAPPPPPLPKESPPRPTQDAIRRRGVERLRPEQPRERRLVFNLVSVLRLRPPSTVVVPRAEQQVTHAPVQGVEPARVAPAAGAKGEGPGAPRWR